jgi:hypothetical protein
LNLLGGRYNKSLGSIPSTLQASKERGVFTSYFCSKVSKFITDTKDIFNNQMVKEGLNAVHHNMDNSYSVMNLAELEKTPIPIDFNT